MLLDLQLICHVSALILMRGWLGFRAHSLVVSHGLICLVAPFDVLFLYLLYFYYLAAL